MVVLLLVPCPLVPVVVVLVSVLLWVFWTVPSFLLFIVVSWIFSLVAVAVTGFLSLGLLLEVVFLVVLLFNEVPAGVWGTLPVIVFFTFVIWDLFPLSFGSIAVPVLVVVVLVSVNCGRFEPWANTCLW